jgi:hypothetical protein
VCNVISKTISIFLKLNFDNFISVSYFSFCNCIAK